jgi:hypothetical protein
LAYGLFSLGSANRANTLASAALYAKIGVDLVFVSTLFDCLNRAFRLACAAGNASIGNFVSHDKYLRKNCIT